MSGTPTRDEQGTRDRPYDLTSTLMRRKSTTFSRHFTSHRGLHTSGPGVFLEMQQGPRSYMVTADADQAAIQRESLLAQPPGGDDCGVPSAAALAESSIHGAAFRDDDVLEIRFGRGPAGWGSALIGRLVWDDRELGWATQWRIDWQNRTHRWRIRGVTFDEAFRRAIARAAQILSGNGDPA